MAAVKAIGLMSGTSLDGVDVALIETDGERVVAFGPVGYRAYAGAERATLRQALAEAVTLTDRRARPGRSRRGRSLGDARARRGGRGVPRGHAIARAEIAVVGFHGQTVLHRPRQGLTVQIGDGPALARSIGLPVVYDLRAADVAAGGEGAPLVPAYHRALVEALDRPRPIVVLNIGGVANVTYIDSGDPIACDTGPGNALIDDFIAQRTGKTHDDGGAMAAQGRVDEALIAAALREPFFDRPPPKSLDRNAFTHVDVRALSTADGAATLTALTAAAVARALRLLPRPARSVIVAGGGARNQTLMAMLRIRLAPATVEPADTVGWSADALEAQAFAFLAVRSMKGLPITFPTTTGVPRALTGGVLVRPGG